MRSRVAVLASGRGSNLEAILAFADRLGDIANYEVSLVASNRADAPALERARSRGIAASHISNPSDGAAVLEMLDTNSIDIVALAGYLKLLPAEVTRLYKDRIINVHPAPLPRFGGAGMYGLKVHDAVIAAGLKETEVTVHFVDAEYDSGDVIARWPVPIHEGDTCELLAERVLKVEHALFPRVLDMVACLAPARLATGTP
ncbi:MAG TPA: phosphoribosylglycinamide formyltransferase [Gemmatimonadaceae bacterium]|nr:phosphoribosylglycinamide formyltransferase [Gemmatimonadaceae bacterium]